MTGGNIAEALACEDTLQRKVRQVIRFPHLHMSLFFKKTFNFKVDIRFKAALFCNCRGCRKENITFQCPQDV